MQTLESEQEQALEALRDARRVVLSGHVRPDGDCIGAQAALAYVLERLGKDVWILNADPVQPQFDYLTRARPYRVYDGGDLPAHDLVVLLDCNELERCGRLAAPLTSATSKKMIVDHHLYEGEPWWDHAFVDCKASATGLLVLRIARALDVELDSVAASGVFTSIVTDTGWFKYSNTDAETLRAAADLLDAGVDAAQLFASIYQRNSSQQPQGLARALERLEYLDDGRIALVDLPRPGAGDKDLSESDELLDVLRAVERVEVALFLRETDEGPCKLSARSKGRRNVHALAKRFGGGGHAKASGATIAGPLAAARARLITEAEELWGARRGGGAA